MKFIPFFLLLFTLSHAAAQASGNTAVFFSVTDYPGSKAWGKLERTQQECADIASDLKKIYGFSTEVLNNKTKAEVKAKITELSKKQYQPDDELLLFFSMHGWFDEDGAAGCLVPYKSYDDDPGFDTWLLHSELQTLVTKIPCQHILVSIDACYSGTFGGNKARPNRFTGSDCADKVLKNLFRKSRLYVTAGGKETTPAQSAFAARWRIALGSLGGDDGILTFDELYLYLVQASPEPKQGQFAGDLGGGFVFVPKGGCGNTPVPSPVLDPDAAACQSARRQGTLDAWSYYLELYPRGKCSIEAQDERAWLLALQRDNRAAYLMYLDTYPSGIHAEEARGKTNTDPQPDNMVLITGGTFKMGSEDGYNDERPVHAVTVSDFYLGKYGVTVAAFRSFIKESGYLTDAEKGGSSWGFEGDSWKEVVGRNWRHSADGSLSPDNHPVVNVSWNDALAYCDWLNNKTGQTYRLPTEAEREYAAGNGSRHTKYCWGDTFPQNKKGGNVADEIVKKQLPNLAIFDGYIDGYVFTSPVGSFSTNDYGLFDMSGNVWEWCNDWKGEYPSGPVVNPKGPSHGSVRVCRGGSWFDGPMVCRVADRNVNSPGIRGGNLGFRLARTK